MTDLVEVKFESEEMVDFVWMSNLRRTNILSRPELACAVWNQISPSCEQEFGLENFKLQQSSAFTDEGQYYATFWLKNKDPLTQANLKSIEDEHFDDLIFQIRTLFIMPYRHNLAKRLVSLMADSKEEDPENGGISVASLTNFLEFIRRNSNIKYPLFSNP